MSAISCGISIPLVCVIKDTYVKAIADEKVEEERFKSLQVPLMASVSEEEKCEISST
jgi:hypothetical protein